MSKRSGKYKVVNNLDNHINKLIGFRMSSNGGAKVLKGDIIEEIANHCDVSADNIHGIKRGVVTPSLSVSLRIANFFRVNVEDIFNIEE